MALTLNNTKKPLPYLPQEMWNKIMYFKDVSEHNDLTKMLVKEIKTERAKDRGFEDPLRWMFLSEGIAEEIAEHFPEYYEEDDEEGNFYKYGNDHGINGHRYFGCNLGESEYAYETEPWRYTHNGKIINID